MTELTGWLLDVYASGPDLAVWILGEDGERRCLYQSFPVSFFAASTGKTEELRALWRFLASQPEPVRLARTERRDLFTGPLTVLQAEVQYPGELTRLFNRTAQAFPNFVYYDSDIQLPLRYSAVSGAFPLGRVQVEVCGNRLQRLTPLDSPWDLDPSPPPLRVLGLEPDCDPAHADPKSLILNYGGHQYRLPLEPARPLLINLRVLLERLDPDLLLTRWGDTWLMPYLFRVCQETGLPLPLNRDPDVDVLRKEQRTYFAYGQVIYRGAQVHLRGRWHVDTCNAVMFADYGMDGIFELARVTGLPVQTVARTSPGTGISSMQIATALRQGILVPWHKQRAESPKTLLELIQADKGGMVYQPTTGLHGDVAEIDFTSMYPSIMAQFNISPETVIPGRYEAGTGLPMTRPDPGLVPQTLEPLLQKRIALKTALLTLPKWDCYRKRYKAMVNAHKWLLVTCFGYLGYKNARFGAIEAHEAVTAYGREALLRAKEAAEDLGFEILHMYVDGLWIKKPGAKTPQDFQPVLDGILERTGLPVALDGVFRWVAFLPSKVDARLPVPNRYFGVFESGEIKVRGIELRQHNTPPFVLETQQELLNLLGRAASLNEALALLPEVRKLVRRRLRQLMSGRLPPEKLVVRQTLSRELEQFRSPSPAAVAAGQLAATGKDLRPGQSIRFLYTLGKPGVRAWDLSGAVDPRTINLKEYRKLFLRAVESVQTPFSQGEPDYTPLFLPSPFPKAAIPQIPV